MSRFLLSILCVAALVAGSLSLCAWIVASAPPPAQIAVSDLGPVPVEWVQARRRVVPRSVSVQGTLRPARTATLAPEVGGLLVEVSDQWRSGAWVDAGTLLWRVNADELTLEVARAVALLEQAAAALQQARLAVTQSRGAEVSAREHRDALAREEGRVDRLVGEGHLRASDLDAAVARRSLADQGVHEAEARVENSSVTVRSAEALRSEREQILELARTRLFKTAARAPFGGRLEGHAPAVGGFVAPGVPLAQLLDVQTLRLLVHVPAEQTVGLRLDMAASVRFPSQPDGSRRARVRSIGAQADPLTRSIPVELELEPTAAASQVKSGGGLAAGLYAEAVIELDPLESTFAFHRESFTFIDGLPHLFVLAQDEQGRDVVLARPVKLAQLGTALSEALWALSGGVEEGERIAVSSLSLLTHGTCVQVRDVAAGDLTR
ncbi:MAG TPA: HlyD family efflux transporter periplasmic adaptor subunit [Planctomycetes bacterium]|nr:HlyD family efflux transporter periplasmic adaptor subunit [Planctomycetota bacterium]HIK61014.1 HlyD family efflux transporter periplasmic adaptor subunit [Planctomycetota bacterium]